MSPPLLIRADASLQIGTGHAMRCLSLAQAWRQQGGAVVFGMAESTSAIDRRLQAAGLEIHRMEVAPGSAEDAARTVALARTSSARWVAADGYRFDADFQRAVKAAGLRLLLFDDYGHATHYSADLVLNQNLHADEALYARRDPQTRLLLGTRYALLRSQFLEWRNGGREIPDVARRILVTLGGADPDNVTRSALSALTAFDAEMRIVVGGSNPHRTSLESEFRCAGREIVVDAEDMPALMAWADLAVAAGGTTSWELAFMGLPSLVLVLADNQQAVAESLDQAGVACRTTMDRLEADVAGLCADVARRREMSRRGRVLVDGDGVARVLTRMRAKDIGLRRAQPADARMLWTWANDAVVRGAAFSGEQIPWETHQRWYAARLASEDCIIFIGMNQGEPFGQIRFDFTCGARAEIDVHVNGSTRKLGLGSALIRAGIDHLLDTTLVEGFDALVKPENTASCRAFEKAGFRRRVSEGGGTDRPFVHLEFCRHDP